MIAQHAAVHAWWSPHLLCSHYIHLVAMLPVAFVNRSWPHCEDSAGFGLDSTIWSILSMAQAKIASFFFHSWRRLKLVKPVCVRINRKMWSPRRLDFNGQDISTWGNVWSKQNIETTRTQINRTLPEYKSSNQCLVTLWTCSINQDVTILKEFWQLLTKNNWPGTTWHI